MLKVAMISKWHVHAEGYARSFNKEADACVTCVWDENPDRGREWAKQLEVPFVENYDAVKSILARESESGLIARITELGEAVSARRVAKTRPVAFDALTQREIEIVRLMAQRLSNREIAERLFLAEGSVKQYVNRIYSKLQIEGDTRTKRKRLLELLRAVK